MAQAAVARKVSSSGPVAAGWPAEWPVQALSGIVAALAVSGLAELVLQRIVYRIGMHIPRQGTFLEAYRFATVSGDFAFRTTAVLLAIAVPLTVIWLWRQRSWVPASLLTLLAGANILAWPLGVRAGVELAPLLFAFGAAWLAGQALGGRDAALKVVVGAAGFALVLSQYRAAMTAFGDEPRSVATLQLLSEVALLVSAAMAGLAAWRKRPSLKAVGVSALISAVLLASYAREPSTVAIVSLWATGVTMSLPGALYIGAFGLLMVAIVTWLRSPETRHLAIAMCMLMVAGLQPQALHHGITAFIGLALLNVSPGQWQMVPKAAEVEHGS